MPTWRGLELPFLGEGALGAAPRPREPEPESRRASSSSEPSEPAFTAPAFERVYAETFPAVWRLVRRMGVVDASVDDVVQEVYVVVHRKLAQFTGASSLKTWVLAITTGVVRNYRRAWRRKGAGSAIATVVEDPDLVSHPSRDPHEQLSRSEAGRLVQHLLDALDDEKAALFVLVELEGLTVPEIASALGTKVQTVYSRLSAARREFERGLRRLRLASRELP